MKALRRLALRFLYPFTKLARLVRGRAPLGACMAVVWEERILVVRHSYRPGQSLPGGRVKSGESPKDAALRELREEVGVAADPAAVRPVYQDLWVRIFEYRPGERPAVRVDETEVVAAEFLDAADVSEPDNPLRGYLLCRVPGGRGNGGREPPV